MNALAYFLTTTLRRLRQPKPEPAYKPFIIYILGATFCATEHCADEHEARERLRQCVQRHLNDGWTFVDATPVATRLRWAIPGADPMDIVVGYDHVGVGMVTPLRTVN